MLCRFFFFFLLPKYPAICYYFLQVNCHYFPFLGQCMSGGSLKPPILINDASLKGSVWSCFSCRLGVCWPREFKHSSCCGKFTLKVTRRFIMRNFFSPKTVLKSTMCQEWILMVIRNSSLPKLAVKLQRDFTCSGPKPLLGKRPEVWKSVSWEDKEWCLI